MMFVSTLVEVAFVLAERNRPHDEQFPGFGLFFLLLNEVGRLGKRNIRFEDQSEI